MIPFPDKRYSIIYADPPWTYEKSGGVKNSRGMAKQHYKTMSLDEIMALPVQDIAADNCALFLWATIPKFPEALRVIEAWGFSYFGGAFVWVKRNPSGKDAVGMGYWTRANPEICILAFRGRLKPQRHDICFPFLPTNLEVRVELAFSTAEPALSWTRLCSAAVKNVAAALGPKTWPLLLQWPRPCVKAVRKWEKLRER